MRRNRKSEISQSFDEAEEQRRGKCRKWMWACIAVFALTLLATRDCILQPCSQLLYGNLLYVPDVCRYIVCAIFICSTVGISHFLWSIDHKGGLMHIFTHCNTLNLMGFLAYLLFLCTVLSIILEIDACRKQNATIVVSNGDSGILYSRYWLLSDSVDGKPVEGKSLVINMSTDTLCSFSKGIYAVATNKSPKYSDYVCIPPNAHGFIFENPDCWFEPSAMRFKPKRKQSNSSIMHIHVLDKMVDLKAHHSVTAGFVAERSRISKEIERTRRNGGVSPDTVSYKCNGDYHFDKNAIYPGGWHKLEKDIDLNLRDTNMYYNVSLGKRYAPVKYVKVKFTVTRFGDVTNIEYVGTAPITQHLFYVVRNKLWNLPERWVPATRLKKDVNQNIQLCIYDARDVK